MRDVLICEPVRTPVGRFGGKFRDISAHALAATVVRGLIERAGLDTSAVDDVVFAQCYPTADAPALGRVVALDAGLPIDVAGLQLDRRCGSGLQAVAYAVMQVATGAGDVVIAGGAESMSNAPFYTSDARWGIKGDAIRLDDALTRGRVTAGGLNFPVPGGMIETAENLRRIYGISRSQQDEYALESHRRAVSAQTCGHFANEIVPVTVLAKNASTLVAKDEHPRADATLEALSSLKPIMSPLDPEATVTAGNSSGQNDGAAACIVATDVAAARHGLQPFARLRAWAVAGVAPALMGIGPVPAVAKALDRAKLRMSDIDLIELNEAFACQVLACTREWKLGKDDFARLNVNGSGIALGHPLGATGGRILTTLLFEMRRRGVRYGLEAMCIGGGQGIAAIFERV